MNPCELTMSVTALANAMACRLSDDELDLAAALFSQRGDTLATISTRRLSAFPGISCRVLTARSGKLSDISH